MISYSSCTFCIVFGQVGLCKMLYNVNTSYNPNMNFTWKIISIHYSCWWWRATIIDIVANGKMRVKFIEYEHSGNWCRIHANSSLLQQWLWQDTFVKKYCVICKCGWWCQKKLLLPMFFDNTCEKQPFNRLLLTIYILFHCITYCYFEIVFKETMWTPLGSRLYWV
jgi:hypothetical protein